MTETTAHHKKSSHLQPVSIPSGVQQAVVGMLLVAWLGTAVYIVITTAAMQSSGFSWILLGLTTILPFVFFLTALLYAWRRYGPVLQKLFVAGILATSGYAAAQVLISFIFTLNNRYNWVETGSGTSDVPVYIFEWMVMLISYATFVIVIGCLPHGKKKAD